MKNREWEIRRSFAETYIYSSVSERCGSTESADLKSEKSDDD